ncbi:MAG: cation-translocating P-type ATPase [Verrucomicrobiota bacterium]
MSSCCCCSSPPESLDPATSDTTGPFDAFYWLRLGIALAISGLTMIFGLGVNFSPPTGWAYIILHTLLAAAVLLVFLLAGTRMLKIAYRQVRSARPGMEALFLLGVTGAFGASLHSSITRTGDIYYEVVAILVAIYSLGQTLTKVQKNKALQAITSVHSRYAQARLADGTYVASDSIQPGQEILIKPGEGIPVDGHILSGTGLVQETPLTGEPFAVSRTQGDRVLAGSDNLDGELMVQATTAGNQRELDTLLQTLQQSRLQQSRIQLQAEQVARVFFPAVVAIALVTFGWWWFQAEWQTALFHALAVIVVACPCALGLATPLAVWSSVNRLYQAGITTRQSDFMERLHRVDTIIFDKTGTLSEIEPRLKEFYTFPGFSESDLKAAIAAIQLESRHPIARLFQSWQTGKRALHCSAIPGVGLSGILNDHNTLRIGNERLLTAKDKQTLKNCAQSPDCLPGERAVYVKINNQLAGVAHFTEQLRADSVATIRTLQKAGYQVQLLSGDQHAPLAALIPAGIDFEAGLTPSKKRSKIVELQNKGNHVLFIGDGTNDAPALDAAHASIAIAGSCDIASQTAQAVIRTENISPLLTALQLSNKTIHTLRSNLVFAASYNAIGITLAATGILNPVWAALLMLASSTTVSGRALKNAHTSLNGVLPLQRKQTKQQGSRYSYVWISSGMIVSAILFAYAGSFGWQGAITVLSITGVMIWLLLRNSFSLSRYRLGCGLCYVWCTAGMLAGWIILAGWRPVVFEGVCLCGCADSPFGEGIASLFNPMYLLMFLSGIAGYLAGSPQKIHAEDLKSHLICAGLMCLTMWSTSLWWALVPVHPNAQYQFLMTAGVMLLSMTVAVYGFEWINRRMGNLSSENLLKQA